MRTHRELKPYLAGQLGSAELVAFEDHLESCQRCRQHLPPVPNEERLRLAVISRAVSQSASSVNTTELDPGSEPTWRSTTETDVVGRQVLGGYSPEFGLSPRRRRWHPVVSFMGAALVVMVAIGVPVLLWGGSDELPDTTSNLITSATAFPTTVAETAPTDTPSVPDEPGQLTVGVGMFRRVTVPDGFSEPRDAVDKASMTDLGMVAVGHGADAEGEPRAWIQPLGEDWMPVEFGSADLADLEGFIDVADVGDGIGILALDILEMNGNPASRQLVILTSSDLENWDAKRISPIEAIAAGFTRVVGISVGDAYFLEDATRFDARMVSVGIGTDAYTLLTSSDGGQHWDEVTATAVTELEDETLQVVAAGPDSVVAGGAERQPDESTPGAQAAPFSSVIVWSSDGQDWERATIESVDATETRITDLISIKDGFLARGISTGDKGVEWRFWVSRTGSQWQAVEIPQIQHLAGSLAHHDGTVTLFGTPSLEPNTDHTGPLEIWQGSISLDANP